MKSIGPSFPLEIEAAGLMGLPFTWGPDGALVFADSVTADQRVLVLAVYDAHDPIGDTGKILVAKDAARREVDIAAGIAALRYITSRPGQEATYMLKLEQARAHQAAGYPADLTLYSMIAVELDAQLVTDANATAQMASDFILATAAAWTAKAAQIESARRVAKEKIRVATTEAAVIAARDSAVAALKAL